MFDRLQHAAKNGAVIGATGLSALNPWLDLIQPAVAVFAGLAGGIYACLQIYTWIKNKNKQ